MKSSKCDNAMATLPGVSTKCIERLINPIPHGGGMDSAHQIFRTSCITLVLKEVAPPNFESFPKILMGNLAMITDFQNRLSVSRDMTIFGKRSLKIRKIILKCP